MIDIYITENFINNIKKIFMKEGKINFDLDTIKEKIKKLLIYDHIINEYDELNFLISKSKFQGVIVENKKMIVYFTQLLKSNKTRSRNTFFIQNLYNAFKFSKKNNYNICCSLNPFDLENIFFKITQNSIILNINEAIIRGAKINKSLEERCPENINEINNINEYLIKKNKIREKNKNNDSTYVEKNDEDKEIIVFGKLDGANFNNTFSLCESLNILNKNLFKLVFIEIHSSNNTIKKLQEIQKLNFYIDQLKYEEKIIKKELELTLDNMLLGENENKNFKEIENILKRNQLLFKKNIIEKYINSKKIKLFECFACDYNISKNFIASHIYRYSDIIKDFNKGKIKKNEAMHLISSGENGFFLCPNHDKEFEKGMIYFDIIKMMFTPNKNKLNEWELVQIKRRLKNKEFYDIKYTEEFSKNLIEHMNRITNS